MTKEWGGLKCVTSIMNFSELDNVPAIYLKYFRVFVADTQGVDDQVDHEESPDGQRHPDDSICLSNSHFKQCFFVFS